MPAIVGVKVAEFETTFATGVASSVHSYVTFVGNPANGGEATIISPTHVADDTFNTGVGTGATVTVLVAVLTQPSGSEVAVTT